MDSQSPENTDGSEEPDGEKAREAERSAKLTNQARLTRLASFPEQDLNPIVEVGGDGCVGYMNPAARQLFPDLAARGLSHPWLADWQADVERIRRTGGRVLTRVVRVGDRSYQQNLSFLAEEGAVRIYGVDITGRLAAEAEVRLSEERFRTLASNAQDSIARFDRQRRFLYVNPYGERLIGLPAEKIVGRTADELGRNLGTASWEARLSEVFATGQPLRFDWKGVDGRWWDVQLIPEGPDGRVEAVLSVARDITERKNAEDAARDSRAKLAAALASMNEAIFIADADGRFSEFNDEFVRYHRFGSREECSKVIADCPKYLDAWFEDGTPAPPEMWAMPRALRGEMGSNVEYMLRRKDTGETWWGSYGFGPIRDTDGRIVGAIVAAREITGRKRAELALKQAQLRTEAILRGIADTFYALDREWRFAVVNPAAERAPFGRPAGELLGKVIWDLYPDLVGTRIQRHYLDAAEKLAPEHYEAQSPLNGRWYEVFMQGWTGGVDVYMRDITERKQAEAALRTSTRLMEAFVANMHGPTLLVGKDKRVVLANQMFCDYFGVSETPAELAGAPSEKMIEKVRAAYIDPDGEVERIEEILRRGEPAFGEEVALRDGRVCLRDFIPMYVEGEFCGRIWQHTDVTDLKRAEMALREADQRKNEFLATLSHELRNPLAPITNSLYILEHAPPGGDQANRARQVIGRQVAQLSHMVNDLLDITRITRNKVQLHRERLDLGEIVRRAVEDNHSLFAQAGVRVDLVLAPRPIFVMADATRIAQVVGNLLQNAAKFTRENGCVRVVAAAEGSEAIVRVSDDGVGMTRDTLQRLFQPFMQASQTLDRSKGGLGLGLSLVKGLVELHGGGVSAHSNGLGQGTEFVVRLPLGNDESLTPPTAHLPTAHPGRRILIIEDNVDAADSLCEALELGAHEVMVAYNGSEGLVMAREFLPEVVLCDLGLPGMDGFAVARAIRADGELKGAFLVALSGYASPEDMQHAAEAGFQRHLAKPPSIEKLEDLLAALPSPRVACLPSHSPPTRK